METTEQSANTGDTPETGNTGVIEQALEELREHADSGGDGRWFEDLIQRVGPMVPEWGLAAVHRWDEWTDRAEVLGEQTSSRDNGIDLIGERRNDSRWIPIQAKARGKGTNVTKQDVDSFLAETVLNDRWPELWIVSTTDANATLKRTLEPMAGDRGRARFHIIGPALRKALQHWRERAAGADPRTGMQNTAVEEALAHLETIRGKQHPGWREHDARGKVIMPCGTGKTRVGYRISAEICRNAAEAGRDGLTVVFAPSIGLVHQLRAQWTAAADEAGETLDTLSVCSDPGTRPTGRPLIDDEEGSITPEKSISEDPAADLSGLSAANLVGETRKSAEGVLEWIKDRTVNGRGRPVIFSTYQSGHHTAGGMRGAGVEAEVLICDEAHRTAGLKGNSKRAAEIIKDFTICHRNDALPARNRVYMTATPRAFARGTNHAKNAAKDVLSMDDEAVFGCDLFRLSYGEAVARGFLTDYRIIAIAPPAESREVARGMALRTAERIKKSGKGTKGGKGQKKKAKGGAGVNLVRGTESLALRQLAYGLVLAGGVDDPEGGKRRIRSSIAFCNRVAHSDDMARELRDDRVRDWLRHEAAAGAADAAESEYDVIHRDAGSSMADREAALDQLRTATADKPVGVTNVGIFGEGIDTPALDAVGFIEARKSPVDVIQTVGRAMRLSENKDLGYVIVPIEIPEGKDPEAWLESRESEDGYKELAQILLALRAHDERIEDILGEMLRIYIPDDREEHQYLVTVATPEGFAHRLATCRSGEIENALSKAKQRGGKSALDLLEDAGVVNPVSEDTTIPARPAGTYIVDGRQRANITMGSIDIDAKLPTPPDGGDFRLRPATIEAEQRLNAAIADDKGNRVKLRKPQRRKQPKKRRGTKPKQLLLMTELSDRTEKGAELRIRILENSGLCGGPRRDMNILREIVHKAADKLRADNLETGLKTELGMDAYAEGSGGRADACTVTALLLTTAAIVQARLEKSGAVKSRPGERLEDIAAAGDAAALLMKSFGRILDKDYRPIFGIARRLVEHLIVGTGKTLKADEAIRGIASEARDVAESYAAMGADYAGELFNEVMGDQASDGAFFTRPIAGTLLAGLALETAKAATAEDIQRLKVLDPTCGSGTLLTAWLHAAKHKAFGGGRTAESQARFHRKMVEESLIGLDINETSLQLAGAQLVIGDPEAKYERMRLIAMPYGEKESCETRAGSLDLLGEPEVLRKLPAAAGAALPLPMDKPGRKSTNGATGEPGTPIVDDGIVEAASEVDVVLTNPPFVIRDKLGKKFGKAAQIRLRGRIDNLESEVERRAPLFKDFCEGQTTRPLYVLLALLAMKPETGILGVCAAGSSRNPGGLRRDARRQGVFRGRRAGDFRPAGGVNPKTGRTPLQTPRFAPDSRSVGAGSTPFTPPSAHAGAWRSPPGTPSPTRPAPAPGRAG